MKSVRLLTPAPVGVGTRGESTVRILGMTVSDPVTVTEFEPPTRFAVEHEGVFTGSGTFTLERGADGTTTIVRWDETLSRAGVPAPRRARARIPLLAAIFQADLDAIARDLVESARADRRRLTLGAGSTSSTPRTSCSVRTTRRARRSWDGDGINLSGVSGLCDQLLYLLREEGATHVGCATDRVIESFRNDLFAGLQVVGRACRPSSSPSSPSPRRRSRRSGSSSGRWSNSRPTTRSQPPPGASSRIRASSRSSSARPDKDMAQLVLDERVVLWDRRRGIVYDDAGVREKWGVAPTSIPDWLGLVGDSSDGFPGIPAGAPSRPRRSFRSTATYEDIPPKASAWEVPGVGGARAVSLAASLRDHWDEALLYRDLARLRSAEDGVPIRQRDPDELRWDGAPRAEWEAFCEEWGLDRLRSRPHRWLDEGLMRDRARTADVRRVSPPAARRYPPR